MEGSHFGAGPWFAVRETPADSWQPYGQVHWSDGSSDGFGTLEMKATLLPADPTHFAPDAPASGGS